MKLTQLTQDMGASDGAPALNLKYLFDTSKPRYQGSWWSLYQQTPRLGLGLGATPPPPPPLPMRSVKRDQAVEDDVDMERCRVDIESCRSHSCGKLLY